LGKIQHALHIEMISVENFYWVLNEQLLKPVGLNCCYYFPFGTQKYFSSDEFITVNSRRDFGHVFFHFDQEPLWSDHMGAYDTYGRSWSVKWPRILANSERSQLKKQVCRSREFLDWYFFYHGFAALDWYSDTKYIDQQHQINNAFLSTNHILANRTYRLSLLARLLDRGITDQGSISFHADLAQVITELDQQNPNLTEPSRRLIEANIERLTNLPWTLDDVPISGDLSARFGHREYRMWQNSLWHLVNETVFHEPKLHLTEKVFKPIVSQRPFVLVAAPGNLEYLRSYGFQTFGTWLDESYDMIQDDDQRLGAISKEIDRYARMSVAELRDIHHDMMPTLIYNKNHFFGDFRRIIVDELVENFQQCLRIWNNGRLDDKIVSLLSDPDSVKKALLR